MNNELSHELMTQNYDCMSFRLKVGFLWKYKQELKKDKK